MFQDVIIGLMHMMVKDLDKIQKFLCMNESEFKSKFIDMKKELDPNDIFGTLYFITGNGFLKYCFENLDYDAVKNYTDIYSDLSILSNDSGERDTGKIESSSVETSNKNYIEEEIPRAGQRLDKRTKEKVENYLKNGNPENLHRGEIAEKFNCSYNSVLNLTRKYPGLDFSKTRKGRPIRLTNVPNEFIESVTHFVKKCMYYHRMSYKEVWIEVEEYHKNNYPDVEFPCRNTFSKRLRLLIPEVKIINAPKKELIFPNIDKCLSRIRKYIESNNTNNNTNNNTQTKRRKRISEFRHPTTSSESHSNEAQCSNTKINTTLKQRKIQNRNRTPAQLVNEIKEYIPKDGELL